MWHARLFSNPEHNTYRNEMWQVGESDDRPLFVQFCANDTEDLLAAARIVEPFCDAVDLNLGCPQGIAKKGHYGAFLMEDWKLIESLIRKLDQGLERVPVTAKIRVFETVEKTVAYAKMVEAAGASVGKTSTGVTVGLQITSSNFANRLSLFTDACENKKDTTRASPTGTKFAPSRKLFRFPFSPTATFFTLRTLTAASKKPASTLSWQPKPTFTTREFSTALTRPFGKWPRNFSTFTARCPTARTWPTSKPTFSKSSSHVLQITRIFEQSLRRAERKRTIRTWFPP